MRCVKKTFTNEKGMFDLGSIMVGLIITGIVASISLASLFVVKPWYDNKNAQDVLNTIKIAEESAIHDKSVYLPLGTWNKDTGAPVAASGNGTLASTKLVSSEPKHEACVVVTPATGSTFASYVAYVRGAGNNWYSYTSKTDTIASLTASAKPANCS